MGNVHVFRVNRRSERKSRFCLGIILPSMILPPDPENRVEHGRIIEGRMMKTGLCK